MQWDPGQQQLWREVDSEGAQGRLPAARMPCEEDSQEVRMESQDLACGAARPLLRREEKGVLGPEGGSAVCSLAVVEDLARAAGRRVGRPRAEGPRGCLLSQTRVPTGGADESVQTERGPGEKRQEGRRAPARALGMGGRSCPGLAGRLLGESPGFWEAGRAALQRESPRAGKGCQGGAGGTGNRGSHPSGPRVSLASGSFGGRAPWRRAAA